MLLAALMRTLISVLLLGLGLVGCNKIPEDYTQWDLAHCDEPGYGECNGASTYPDNCICSKPHKAMRAMIVNGTEAKPFQYCFLCGIVFATTRFCAGTLISKKHLLTAAHCTDGFTAEELHVVCGIHEFDGTGNYPRSSQKRKVKRIIQHSGYDSSVNFHNDISLMELEEVKFNYNVCPVCMPSTCVDMFYNPEIRIIGWGAGKTGGTQNSRLQQGCSRPIGIPSCAKVYGRYVDKKNNPSTHLCHEQRDGGTCQGDSGGSVLSSGEYSKCLVVQGVTSYGSDKCGDYKPSVATRVCTFMDWIKENIGETQLCYAD